MKAPLWIDLRDALALHGGAAGVRDDYLLQSALAQPRQHYAYATTPRIVEMAALYMAGIVRNHSFVDGNKRTSFVVGVLFLEINGHRFMASEEDATQAILGLAAGDVEESAFAAWLRTNVKQRKRS